LKKADREIGLFLCPGVSTGRNVMRQPVDRILLGKIVQPDPAEFLAGFPEKKSNP
jgi:hypothetical protein